MPTTKVNGVRIYHEVHGEGPPLVLCHSFALDVRIWTPNLAELARFHRVIVYDVRGHGRTEVPKKESSYSYPIFAKDLARLADHLNLERFSLAGLCMGGQIASLFALEHPERVSSLILINTGPFLSVKHDPAVEAHWRGLADRIEKEGIEANFQALAGNMTSPRFQAARSEGLELLRRIVLSAPAQGLAQTIRGAFLTVEDNDEEFRKLEVPVLVVLGELDATWSARSEPFRKTIPHAEWLTVKDAGHLANLEKPDEFNGAVLRFLVRGRLP